MARKVGPVNTALRYKACKKKSQLDIPEGLSVQLTLKREIVC